MNQSGNTAQFFYDAQNYAPYPTVYYKYGEGTVACPEKNSSKRVMPYKENMGTNTGMQLVNLRVQIPGINEHQFLLTPLDFLPDMGIHNPDVDYSWTLRYTSEDNSNREQIFKMKGKFVSSPVFPTSDVDKYTLNWTLQVKTPYDSVIPF